MQEFQLRSEVLLSFQNALSQLEVTIKRAHDRYFDVALVKISLLSTPKHARDIQLARAVENADVELQQIATEVAKLELGLANLQTQLIDIRADLGF